MIERLAAALRNVDADSGWRDVADVLWLAARKHDSPSPERTDTAVPAADPEPAATPSPRRGPPKRTGPPPSTLDSPLGIRRAVAGETPETSYEVVAPTRLALPDRLGIGRALRPLKQRRRSRRHEQFDTDATIEQYCETRILVPILSPAPERWFHELALVADGGPTMVVWRETIDALADLLAHHGAVDRVARWTLDGDHASVHLRSPTGQRHDPRELVDHDGRRVTLVVSDCVGELWRGGAVWQTLRDWGRVGPVAIVQTLPSRLWPATALGVADVTLGAHRRGEPNNQLRVRLPWWWADDGTPAATPVVTLAEGHLANWARLVAGRSGVEVAGVVTQPPDVVAAEAAAPALGAVDRVAAFRTTVSPEAYRLAVLLSAVDVSLPVARLVLDRLVPSPRQTHLAEVFASGLVQPTGEEAYDFAPGVRELLQESLTTTSTIDVWRTVAPYLEASTGHRAPFSALLDPTSAVSVEAVASGTYRVAADLVARLGLVAAVRAPVDVEPVPVSTVELRAQLTVGILGADGHGKTTLADAISAARPRRSLDLSRLPGRVRDLSWDRSGTLVEDARGYLLVDWAAERDLVTALLSGGQSIDAALLVVAASDGPMPATREHVRIAQATGVSSIIVVLTKCDLVEDEELLELVELEVRELLHAHDFPGDDVPVYRISAAKALESDTAWRSAIREMLDAFATEIADPPVRSEQPLLIPITTVERAGDDDAGWALGGVIEHGLVRPGAAVDFLVPGYRLRTTVESVVVGQATVDLAAVGSTVRLTFADVTADVFQPAVVVAEPGTVTTTNTFTGIVQVFSPDAFGARRGRIEVHWVPDGPPWRAEETGFSYDQADDPSNWPGQPVPIRVRLPLAIPVRPGLPFTIRDGDSIVAIGVVSADGLTIPSHPWEVVDRLPHVDSSTAILIGPARYLDPALPALPQVEADVRMLADTLKTGSGGGFAPSRIHAFVDPSRTDVAGIDAAAQTASDVVLIYYGGHSVLGEGGELYLTLADSELARRFTLLRFTELLEILGRSPARSAILILDTPRSDLAFDRWIAWRRPVTPPQTDVGGTYLLAPVALTSADPREHTTFTSTLLGVLRQGIVSARGLLRLTDMQFELQRRLDLVDGPGVRWIVNGTIEELALVRNARSPNV